VEAVPLHMSACLPNLQLLRDGSDALSSEERAERRRQYAETACMLCVPWRSLSDLLGDRDPEAPGSWWAAWLEHDRAARVRPAGLRFLRHQQEYYVAAIERDALADLAPPPDMVPSEDRFRSRNDLVHEEDVAELEGSIEAAELEMLEEQLGFSERPASGVVDPLLSRGVLRFNEHALAPAESAVVAAVTEVSDDASDDVSKALDELSAAQDAQKARPSLYPSDGSHLPPSQDDGRLPDVHHAEAGDIATLVARILAAAPAPSAPRQYPAAADAAAE